MEQRVHITMIDGIVGGEYTKTRAERTTESALKYMK